MTSSVKQQLGPAFLAAAAAWDVEAGKLLLNYCPDLLDYALWTSPSDIRNSPVSVKSELSDFPDIFFDGTAHSRPWVEVLPFVSQLHRGGFTGIHLSQSGSCKVHQVLRHLCHHNQRHQPESVQMLLDLGLVSCHQEVFYKPSQEVRPKGYVETTCPIISVALSERNAGAVAVLVAAGAVLPEPVGELYWKLPYNQSDLQAVVSDLDEQLAAAVGGDGGGGVTGAAQYQKAADVLRAYCEEHGRGR
jgi:hypothetical protein